MNNLEKLFSDWGSAQRRLPENHQVMKAEALNQLKADSAARPAFGRRLPWVSFAFTGLAVLALLVAIPKYSAPQYSSGGSVNSISQGLSGSGPDIASSNAQPTMETAPPIAAGQPQRSDLKVAHNPVDDSYGMPLQPVPPQPQDVGASDSRELIKTDYNASIQTRDVQGLTGRIQTTVRGFGGRVDSVNSTDSSGFVSFVVPADKLDAFKTEVKNMAGARFYTEQTTAENLLPQKVAIEDRQKQQTDQLAQLNAGKDQLTKTHNQTVASINAQLSANAKESAALAQEAQTTLNYDRQLQIQARQQELQNQNQALKARLARENSDYQNQLDSFNSQIQNAQDTLSSLAKQTGDLLDTVATVRGTISLSWISEWDILNLYLPAYWLVYLLLLGAGVSYYLYRRSMRIQI